MFPPRFSAPHGDGFTILEDAEVSFASKGDCKLPIRLRRVSIKRHDADDAIVLITQEMTHSATDIAALYKGRWQIELLLRSIKQHLKIRKFLANNDNAIRLQLFAAMIAYALPAWRSPHPRHRYPNPQIHQSRRSMPLRPTPYRQNPKASNRQPKRSTKPDKP